MGGGNDGYRFREFCVMTALDPLTWAVLLMLLGCALLVMEVFIPSGGVLSLFSTISIVASIVFAFRRDMNSGLIFILVTLVAVPGVVALAFKVWPMTPMGKAFLGELPSEDETKTDDPRRQLVGRLGIAKSKMLPSGSVLIEGHILDAVCQGGAIEAGEPIVVVEVRGNRVVVRQAEPEERSQQVASSGDVLSKSIDELGLESFEEPLS